MLLVEILVAVRQVELILAMEDQQLPALVALALLLSVIHSKAAHLSRLMFLQLAAVAAVVAISPT
jgi:hypothetical protein